MENIKVGVFGAGRGYDIAENFMLLNCNIVAICDFHEGRLNEVLNKLGKGATAYKDFDEFIEHDMDAVIVANYCNEHAPYVIKCFERNIHVFCECISNGTMAEGVELARAFKNTKSVFYLAENYPQMLFNREIKKVCDSGTLGKILFAEGEYNHPVNPEDVEFIKRYNYFKGHWRNYLPRTYYITHSLGPVMNATGATPKKVTAFACYAPDVKKIASASYVGDRSAIITTLNDDGSVFRITGCSAFGAHENSYRVCGTDGQIENVRGMGNKVMLRYNYWNVPEGMEENNLYEPSWNDKDEELITKSGHGGGDYLTARDFLDCIKEGRQPNHPFNLHSALAMSSVAILAHRSMLEGGMPYDIPDFTCEEDLKKYENDRHTPFTSPDGTPGDLPCCSNKDYKPTEKQLEMYEEYIK